MGNPSRHAVNELGGVFFELLGGIPRAEEGVLLNRDRRY